MATAVALAVAREVARVVECGGGKWRTVGCTVVYFSALEALECTGVQWSKDLFDFPLKQLNRDRFTANTLWHPSPGSNHNSWIKIKLTAQATTLGSNHNARHKPQLSAQTWTLGSNTNSRFNAQLRLKPQLWAQTKTLDSNQNSRLKPKLSAQTTTLGSNSSFWLKPQLSAETSLHAIYFSVFTNV